MRRIATQLVISLGLFVTGAASGAEDRSTALTRLADETARYLTQSSMAARIDPATLRESSRLLASAREEIAAGHLRTAQNLIERAGEPLHVMSDEARRGHHPDRAREYQEKREALISISEGVAQVASGKGLRSDVPAAVRASVAGADQLAESGRLVDALAALEASYLRAQREVARLRDGDSEYLPIAVMPPEVAYSDALRRFDERRVLTQLLAREAEAEGVTPDDLRLALNDAEAMLGKARSLAAQADYGQAVQVIEVAYLTVENSWRKAGIEW